MPEPRPPSRTRDSPSCSRDEATARSLSSPVRAIFAAPSRASGGISLMPSSTEMRLPVATSNRARSSGASSSTSSARSPRCRGSPRSHRATRSGRHRQPPEVPASRCRDRPPRPPPFGRARPARQDRRRRSRPLPRTAPAHRPPYPRRRSGRAWVTAVFAGRRQRCVGPKREGAATSRGQRRASSASARRSSSARTRGRNRPRRPARGRSRDGDSARAGCRRRFRGRDPSRPRRVSRSRRPARSPRRGRTRSPGFEGPHARPTVAPRNRAEFMWSSAKPSPSPSAIWERYST